MQIITATQHKISKDPSAISEGFPNNNALLPSISQTKLTQKARIKSYSAKKLPVGRTESLNNSSTKRSLDKGNDYSSKTELKTSKKIDLEGIVARKQQLTENSNKQFSTRTKVLSTKTPMKPRESKISEFL